MNFGLRVMGSTRHRTSGAPTLIQSKDGGHGSGTTSAVSSAVGFASTTLLGSLLVLVAWGQNTTTGGDANASLSVSTAGFSWTSAGAAGTYSTSGGNAAGAVQIYFIANAASMASSVHTTVTSSGSADSTSSTVEFSLYEFGPINGTKDVYQASSGTSSVPSTANLSTSFTDLIFAAYIATDAHSTQGSGFTLGVDSGTLNYGGSQYILSDGSGSIATAFAGSRIVWAAAAVAFKT